MVGVPFAPYPPDADNDVPPAPPAPPVPIIISKLLPMTDLSKVYTMYKCRDDQSLTRLHLSDDVWVSVGWNISFSRFICIVDCNVSTTLNDNLIKKFLTRIFNFIVKNVKYKKLYGIAARIIE